MTDSPLPDSSRLLHHAYMQAVAYCDRGPSTPLAPDEWYTYQGDGGALAAMFYYRRTESMTVRDHHGVDITLTPVVNGQAWQHGLALSWDELDGWTYTALYDEHSTVGDWWTRLPVPRLASPAAIRALLPVLLDGREDELPRSVDQWQEPRAYTLGQHLALADAARERSYPEPSEVNRGH
ncbi:hypothetical protein AB0465_37500 [Streptomyces griseoviridis]|uniref:hypothetical protein n=1 Tax=Streptomyces griseoviridis TaxID=45398 RepID=UPI00344D19F8